MGRDYPGGLHEIGDGVHAFLQPDGSWGLSNAGLIVSDGKSLLVDTLFTYDLTQAMLDEMARAQPAARAIDVVVNTHANGDHCWGNALVEGAEIVASRACASEMEEVPPTGLPSLVANASRLGRLGEWVVSAFGRFNFDGIELRLPTTTFDGELELKVGDRVVRLIEVGPAHTKGDVIIELASERVCFAGDILMIGGHPLLWCGPLASYLAALDRIAAMDVDVIVPGHGPLVGKDAVEEIHGFLTYLDRETRARHAAGMDPLDAALDIPLDGWGHLAGPERMAVNVGTIYRELDGTGEADRTQQLHAMAEYAARVTR